MSARYTTAGTYLMYAVEATADTRPTSDYILIPEVKSMPSFNPAPDGIESTTLMETVYKTYEQGLKDPGGTLEYSANLTMDLVDAWRTLVSAYETAAAAGKNVWFAIVHRTFPEAVYYKGAPAPIGLNEITVSAMLETTLYITPTGAPEMAAKPTNFTPPTTGGGTQTASVTPTMSAAPKKAVSV